MPCATTAVAGPHRIASASPQWSDVPVAEPGEDGAVAGLGRSMPGDAVIERPCSCDVQRQHGRRRDVPVEHDGDPVGTVPCTIGRTLDDLELIY